LGTLNYQTLILDSILIGNEALDIAKDDGVHLRNASINSLRVANSTLQHDWSVIRDPNTWDIVRNESIEEFKTVENQAEDRWDEINEAGRMEWSNINLEMDRKWQVLKDETEKEWESLSLLATEKWNDIENVTEDMWNNWSESISTEFERFPNQTRKAYHHIDNEARNDWNRFTNQTYKDWVKISKSVQARWRQILNSSESKWSEESKTTEEDRDHTVNDINVKSNVTEDIGTDESKRTPNASINSTENGKRKRNNNTNISSESNWNDVSNVTKDLSSNSTEASKHKLHNKKSNHMNFDDPIQEKNSTETMKQTQNVNSTELDWISLPNSTQDALNHLIETTKHEWHNITKTTKRKWHNLVQTSDDAISEARYHLTNITETGKLKLKNITDNSGETLNNIRDSSIIWWNDLRGGISSSINSTSQVLTDAEDATMKKLKEMSNSAPKVVEELNTNVNTTVNSVMSKAGSVLQSAQGHLNKFGEDIKDEWGVVSSPATIEKVKNTSSTLVQDAKNASSSGIDFVKEKVKGMLNDISGDESSDSNHRLLANSDESIPYDWGWGYYAYMIGVCAVFMGTIILEGVDTSIMCKAAPARLNSTFINVGLLATLIGTLGRVVGDGLITASAFIDRSRYTDFINNVYLPLIPVTILGIYYVYKYYNALL